MNVSIDWLQTKLCSGENVIIVDCRNNFDYDRGHIKKAINFQIPSIMLRRLQCGKIDLLSTIRTAELRERVEKNLENGSFVLYNDNNISTSCIGRKNEGGNDSNNANTLLNVLQRRLHQDNNCLVFCLEGLYTCWVFLTSKYYFSEINSQKINFNEEFKNSLNNISLPPM